MQDPPSHLMIIRRPRSTVRGTDPSARISATGQPSETMDGEAQEDGKEGADDWDTGTDDAGNGSGI